MIMSCLIVGLLTFHDEFGAPDMSMSGKMMWVWAAGGYYLLFFLLWTGPCVFLAKAERISAYHGNVLGIRPEDSETQLQNLLNQEQDGQTIDGNTVFSEGSGELPEYSPRSLATFQQRLLEEEEERIRLAQEKAERRRARKESKRNNSNGEKNSSKSPKQAGHSSDAVVSTSASSSKKREQYFIDIEDDLNDSTLGSLASREGTPNAGSIMENAHNQKSPHVLQPGEKPMRPHRVLASLNHATSSSSSNEEDLELGENQMSAVSSKARSQSNLSDIDLNEPSSASRSPGRSSSGTGRKNVVGRDADEKKVGFCG